MINKHLLKPELSNMASTILNVPDQFFFLKLALFVDNKTNNGENPKEKYRILFTSLGRFLKILSIVIAFLLLYVI